MNRLFPLLAGALPALAFPAFALPASAATLTAGLDDAFGDGPDPAIPGAELARVLSVYHGTQDFDLIPKVGEGLANRQIAHTLANLPADIVSATLELRARAGQAAGTGSDGIFLAFTGPRHETFPQAVVFRRSFGPISASPPNYPFDDPGLVGAWEKGDEVEITLDLAALPQPDGTTLDLLPAIRVLGFLDVVVSEDTGVDFYRLDYLTSSAVGATLAGVSGGVPLSAAPNPFRHATRIAFALSVRADATVRVFDVAGRAIRTWHQPYAGAGPYEIEWDGRDELGRDAGSGVFFYRLETAGVVTTERIVRLR